MIIASYNNIMTRFNRSLLSLYEHNGSLWSKPVYYKLVTHANVGNKVKRNMELTGKA